MTRAAAGLDPRAWLAWAAAAMLPPLLGRNPFPLAVTLLAVLAVRVAWSPTMRPVVPWPALVRLAVVFATISVVFNVLTVRAGDRVIVTLPNAIPLVGGELTLNAVVFGLLSGLALITLVLIGTTLGALLDWSATIRALPASVTTIAVAGAIACAGVGMTLRGFGF